MSETETICERITKKIIKRLQIEIDILKKLLEDLREMNSLGPIDFGFVECTFSEYLVDRELNIKKLKQEF